MLNPVKYAKSSISWTRYRKDWTKQIQKDVSNILAQLRAFSSSELMSFSLVWHMSIHLSIGKQGTNCNYWTPEAVLLHKETPCDPFVYIKGHLFHVFQ